MISFQAFTIYKAVPGSPATPAKRTIGRLVTREADPGSAQLLADSLSRGHQGAKFFQKAFVRYSGTSDTTRATEWESG